MDQPDTRCSVGSLSFRNPLLLASGILGETSGSMVRAFEGGAGGVVTKSIGSAPRRGYKNPTIFQFEDGLLNAMGLPNPGIEAFGEVIARTKLSGAPVIGSIFGSDENEFGKLARAMESFGADAVELNLSCPHVEGFGSEIGGTPEAVHAIVKAVKRATSIPVWAKMTPNAADVALLAESAEKAGADAVVAINTVKAMAVSARLRRPVLSNAVGGLSGHALKYVGLRAVFEIGRRCTLPVIGAGGIQTGEDVAEYIMAGASAVQIGTAVAQRGPEMFGAVADELKRFMAEEGFSSIGEMRGIAAR